MRRWVTLIPMLGGCGAPPPPPPPTQALPTPPAPPPGLENLLVLARSLPAGSVVGAADVTWRPVPPRFVPPDAVRDPAELVGRVLPHDVLASEVIFHRRLQPVESRPPAGQELVSLPMLATLGAVMQAGELLDVFRHDPAGLCLLTTAPLFRDLDGRSWLQVPTGEAARLGAIPPGSLSVAGRRTRTPPPTARPCPG